MPLAKKDGGKDGISFSHKKKEGSLVLKLPLCPYCKAHFLYGQVRKNRKQKEVTCPHCKKSFQVKSVLPCLLLFLIAAVLAVGCNLLLLVILPYLTVLALAVNTALILLIAWLLIPYVIRHKPLTEQTTEQMREKKLPEKKTEFLFTAPAPGRAPSRKMRK